MTKHLIYRYKSEMFNVELMENPTLFEEQEKTKLISEMRQTTKEAWGDPAGLLERWFSLAEVLVIVRQDGIMRGFATGKTAGENILLFPVTITHPEMQKKKLGTFMNLCIAMLIWRNKIREFKWNIRKYLRPFYIVFRTANPILYKAILKKFNVFPSLKRRNPSACELTIAKKMVSLFFPEGEFDSQTFVTREAFRSFPELIYDVDKIPWSRDKEVNNFFEKIVQLKEKNGNALVVVGKIPKMYIIYVLYMLLKNYKAVGIN